MNMIPHWASAAFSDPATLDNILATFGLDFETFNIEEFWSAVNGIERILGLPFIRMDFGVPGLTPPEACLPEHIAAVKNQSTAQHYPPHVGIQPLRAALAEFVTTRIAACIKADDIFITCGATQALFVAQAIATKMAPHRTEMVFLTPTYPPMPGQARFLGMQPVCIEMDNKRGHNLLHSIEVAFQRGSVAGICWASPGNPSWIILDNEELDGIARLCKQYNVIPIEDLTYLGMQDVGSGPDRKQHPSIAAYAEHYFLVLSSSKMLSYAGERVGFLVGSPATLQTQATELKTQHETTSVYRACSSLIFNLTAGAPHSSQYAVAAALRAINQGELDIESMLSVYARRMHAFKNLLLTNGFYLIYNQNNTHAQDGFYICFGYPGLNGTALAKELLYIGTTVLPLSAFCSERTDGVRACIARVNDEQLTSLQYQLTQFRRSDRNANVPRQQNQPQLDSATS